MFKTLPIVLIAFILCCACDDADPIDERADVFAIGLEKIGDNGLTLTLASMDPAPPQKGDNIWTISLKDAAGNPVSNATLDVNPRMPDHGHGTPVIPEIEAGTEDGQYIINKLNLWMPGLWEVTIGVESENSPSDTFVLRPLIEG